LGHKENQHKIIHHYFDLCKYLRFFSNDICFDGKVHNLDLPICS
jgi:hypothetical protein